MREAPTSRLPAALALVVGLGLGGPAVENAPAQDAPVTLEASRPASGEVRSLEVSVRYAAGRIDLGAAPEGELYRYRLTYDERAFRPVNEWSLEEGVGTLRVGIRRAERERSERSWWRRLLDLDFGFGLEGVETDEGALDLRLPPRVPTRLEMDVGAAEGLLDLGGLSLTDVRVTTGATDTEVTFDAPNRVAMERLRVEAGAASFRASGLGNARAREITLRGGVGDVTLDFTGNWSGDTRASVEMAMGSLRLVVPRDLGVQIHREGFLTSMDAPGFMNTEGGGLESPNWSSAEHRLEISIRSALGSVELHRVR